MDLDDLPDEVRSDIKFVPVEKIEEAMDTALTPAEKSEKPKMGWFYERQRPTTV
jgi:ATP-dependent Lon protease